MACLELDKALIELHMPEDEASHTTRIGLGTPTSFECACIRLHIFSAYYQTLFGQSTWLFT